jgi:hypothetical protein
MKGFASRDWVLPGLPGDHQYLVLQRQLLHQHEFPADVLSHGNALALARTLRWFF